MLQSSQLLQRGELCSEITVCNYFAIVLQVGNRICDVAGIGIPNIFSALLFYFSKCGSFAFSTVNVLR